MAARKYHIGKNGPAPCRAVNGNCPFGGDDDHTDTLESAYEKYAEIVRKDDDTSTNLFGTFRKTIRGKVKQVIDSGNKVEDRPVRTFGETTSYEMIAAEKFLPLGDKSGGWGAFDNSLEYYEATNQKHFKNHSRYKPGSGSVFTAPNVRNLTDLMLLTIQQRREASSNRLMTAADSLEGDDREKLIEMGADEKSFMPNARYLIVKTRGEVQRLALSDYSFENNGPIFVEESKSGHISLYTTGEATPTDMGVVVIGEKNGREVVFTAHPGLPAPSSSSGTFDSLRGRETVTPEEIIELAGTTDIKLGIRTQE